jgi:porin
MPQIFRALLLWPCFALAQQDWSPSLTVVTEALNTRGPPAGPVGLGRAQLHVIGDLGEGREAVVDAMAISGGSISSRVGDAQGVSNIEGPRSIRLFDLYVQTPLGESSAMGRVGIIDLNSFFYVQGDAAGNFVNSSHGVGPEFSHSSSGGPSIYPRTRFGAIVEQPAGPTVLRLGSFSASTGDHSRGALVIGELEAGGARAGAWSYTSPMPQIAGNGSKRGDHGAYAIFDAKVSDALGAWVTMGRSSAAFNPVNSYVGAGFALVRGRVTWGAAVASAGFPNAAPRETNIEFTAAVDVSHGFTVQPDVQRIAHPSGNRGTTWVGGIRLRYKWDGARFAQAGHLD